MPKKLLALLLVVIALFAIIDLTRAASTHFAGSFAGEDVATANAAAKAPSRAQTAPAARYGIVRATWGSTETR